MLRQAHTHMHRCTHVSFQPQETELSTNFQCNTKQEASVNTKKPCSTGNNQSKFKEHLVMCGFGCNYYKLNVDSSRENGKDKPFRLVVDLYGFFNETLYNFNIWSHLSNILVTTLTMPALILCTCKRWGVGGSILLMCHNAFLNYSVSILKFIGI